MLAKNLASVQLQMEEHRMLRELLESIIGYARPEPAASETIAGQERQERWLREVRHALALLHESASVHFHHEEEGILAEHALDDFGPPHSETASVLRGEHAGLLAQIATVRRLADQPGREVELVTRLNELCGRLRTHESAENQLVGALFGIEVSG